MMESHFTNDEHLLGKDCNSSFSGDELSLNMPNSELNPLKNICK